MLRIHVCTTCEFMLSDALKASLRAAHYATVEDIDGDAPVDVVIVPVESVDESCRLIAHFVGARPAAPVLALGRSCPDDEIVALIEAGAKGYVDRTQRLAQLLLTIEALVRRQARASGRVTAQVIRKIQHLRGAAPADDQGNGLTHREQTILQLIGGGYSNKEIAETLAISANTVKNHVHSVLEKLQVRGRREAARVLLSSPGRMKMARAADPAGSMRQVG